MPELTDSQLLNLVSLTEASREFGNDAGIRFADVPLCKEILVLESGHQPNFLPHSGLWKKIFLLDLFKKKHEKKGKKAIALFGFADYNQCTSKLLTQNKFPAYNKNGYEKFGFKIAEKDVWKRFDYLNKPDRADWENSLGKIASHYKKFPVYKDIEFRVKEMLDILYDCYERAKNFPDINAYFITKISAKFGFDVHFFRYSDLQKKGIFREQWENIISNLELYNGVYNKSIRKYELEIPLSNPDSLPFWFHCRCGAKVQLSLKDKYATGRCRVCNADHEINTDGLSGNFEDMSPNAVARNIIFSDGLGTSIFISGVGGGLAYGRISDDVSIKLGLNPPVTVSWKSKDYYTGPAHAVALGELAKICGIKKENVLSKDINELIKNKKMELEKKSIAAREMGDKKEIQKYEGEYRNLYISLGIIKAIFATTPSFVDILASQGVEKVKNCWDTALKETEEENIQARDVFYDIGALSLYEKIDGISL